MVHILHCTEYPYSTFAVMDSGNCLVADISFDIIMSHMKVLYAPRKGQKFEVPYVQGLYSIYCTSIVTCIRLEVTNMKQIGTLSSLELFQTIGEL